MVPNTNRCRHFQVNWTSSHTCRCLGCGKSGHWFEKEGLVMWLRDDEAKARLTTGLPVSLDVSNNQLPRSVSVKAG